MQKYIPFFFLFSSLYLAGTAQTLPGNMYPDSHAPFIHGVTSGDPLDTAVIIWTRIEPSAPSDVLTVSWEVAIDVAFTNLIATGTVVTDSSMDWCVKHDVTGLNPHSQYFYRFHDGSGNYSDIGRTRTAPNGAIPHSRLAIMSCSSVFSGYFNAYRRIAERQDLDLIVHVGDYIYDFVDADEEVRIPTPYPIDPTTLPEWRDRHKYYLLDPDLREARRMHPWIALWDNHDVDYQNGHEDAPFQAWHEYIPTRMPDSADIRKIYRKLPYGSLMDIMVTDVLLYKDIETVNGTDPSMIGNTQYNWLTNQLSTSGATWKILPMQNLMAGWSINGIPQWIGLGSGQVLDDSNWDGYDADRDRVLTYLEQNNIDNTVVLSGDSHVTIFSDLTVDSADGQIYDPSTGAGSVGVEMLPTSISRGNFDEMGFGFAVPIVMPILGAANPQHVKMELTLHGYGILDIKPDAVIGEVWYSDIMGITTQETFGGGFTCLEGTNHWNRSEISTPSAAKDINSLGTEELSLNSTDAPKLSAFPNPVTAVINLEFNSLPGIIYQIEVYDMTGSRTSVRAEVQSTGNTTHHMLNLSSLSEGTYLVCVRLKGAPACASVIVHR